jgi:hypothetical protein
MLNFRESLNFFSCAYENNKKLYMEIYFKDALKIFVVYHRILLSEEYFEEKFLGVENKIYLKFIFFKIY